MLRCMLCACVCLRMRMCVHRPERFASSFFTIHTEQATVTGMLVLGILPPYALQT